MKPGTTAVIFVSKRAAIDAEGYAKAAVQMDESARKAAGYCGMHSVRDADAYIKQRQRATPNWVGC